MRSAAIGKKSFTNKKNSILRGFVWGTTWPPFHWTPPWRHSLYATVTSRGDFLKHCKHCPYTKILTLLLLCVGVSKCFSNINHNQNAIQQVVNYVIMWQALQRLYNVGWISYSWFSLMWWDGHVLVQNNSKMLLKFCRIIESNSQKTFLLLSCRPTWPLGGHVKTENCICIS